jgi:hypothetical protein
MRRIPAPEGVNGQRDARTGKALMVDVDAGQEETAFLLPPQSIPSKADRPEFWEAA